jgi:transcription-repair coupling factor (superfamily II helicase)
MDDKYQFFDLQPILEELKKNKKVTVSGLHDSALSLFIYELTQLGKKTVLIVPPDKRDSCFAELARLVPSSILVDEDSALFEPAAAVVTASENLGMTVAIREPVAIKNGTRINADDLLFRLGASGFTREEIVEEEGEYAFRGGIIDIRPPAQEAVRIELDGDTVHSIRFFNTQTQRSTMVIQNVDLNLVKPSSSGLLSELVRDHLVISGDNNLPDRPGIILAPDGGIRFDIRPAFCYFGNFKLLHDDLRKGDHSYVFLIDNPDLEQRLRELVGDITVVHLTPGEGFVNEQTKTVYLTDNEIFGRIKRKKEKFKGLFIDDLKGLREGDFVVHSDFGIGQYKGLVFLEIDREKVECLRVDYANNARIFVPVEKMNQLERYISASGTPPRLSKLGSDLWTKTKSKIRKATEKLAFDLLQLYVKRHSAPGFAFSRDTLEMAELESSFPFEETADQTTAIRDAKKDMESSRPADRLICGDVGYGKTEVALRAAFKAALDGKQTMLLCPTTLLAFQHYNTFRGRLKDFPVKAAMISRLKKAAAVRAALDQIRSGRVDIAIGTHRLLQPDVQFKDLGLLIIDEEQRFGVAQKEKIKRFRPGIDILHLSATPIPRTLYMALTGIKDISNIRTPPAGRMDIVTRIIYFDENELRKIIKLEITRGGQVFVVHNRIQTIETMRTRIQRIVPDARICVLHGKVKEEVTEKKMIDFINGDYDILLSTAIIESGLDMPRVNTIIVNEAHMFGLADLHQLRGRVGRSDIQAFAYFIVPSRTLTDEAHKRLSALVSYASLGSGFRLAVRDMEIRGTGNLVGKEQSGYISSIGYHHYVKMLASAVSEARGRQVSVEPVLSLGIEAYFPSEYIGSAYERTALYKRLMDAESEFELNSIQDEIVDRFGKYPAEVDNLFAVSRIRLRALELGAHEVTGKGGLVNYYAKGILIKSEELEQTK